MELYPWQKEYINGLPPKHIFAADTGTGKTFMSLAHYHSYYPNSDVPLLIIAPASKVRTKEWDVEIQVYFADKVMPEYKIYSYEGISRNKQRDFKLPNGAYKREKGPPEYHQILQQDPFPAVIADECHKAANPQSLMGQAIFHLAARAHFFIGLSATPIPNGWISVANYFKIWGYSKHITDFKRRYVHEDRSRGYPRILGYFYQDELKERWNRISKKLKKEDVLTPNEILEIKAPLANIKEYVRIQTDRIVDGELLDNPSKYTHALRQATIKGKLDWLETILDNTDENVLIFYNYIVEREAILKVLDKIKKPLIYRVDGQIQNQPAKHQWSSITNSVTLAQYQSGSTGIELTYASVIIFLSPTYSYSGYEQAKGRVDRIGQTKPITVYKPYLRGTIEGSIWLSLSRKSDFQETVWLDNEMPEEDY